IHAVSRPLRGHSDADLPTTRHDALDVAGTAWPQHDARSTPQLTTLIAARRVQRLPAYRQLAVKTGYERLALVRHLLPQSGCHVETDGSGTNHRCLQLFLRHARWPPLTRN